MEARPAAESADGFVDPDPLEPALHCSLGARPSAVVGNRCNTIVDIAATIQFKLELIILICVQKWNC